MKRWLFTYWLLYHPAAVCSVVAAPDYYSALRNALNGPRGRERRHFRGANAETAIDVYESMGTPEHIVDTIIWGAETLQDVLISSKKLPQFGPWIGFKIADMAERILREPISFDDCYLGLYKDPLQGAALIMKGDWRIPMNKQEVVDTYDFLLDVFDGWLAPPHYDRPINLQEVETIACKYKSHYKGHYPVGLDTREITAGLEQAWSNDLRDDLLTHMRSLNESLD